MLPLPVPQQGTGVATQQGHLLQIFESSSCHGFSATADAAAAAKALADTPRADFGL
jgi:hypothetical protein